MKQDDHPEFNFPDDNDKDRVNRWDANHPARKNDPQPSHDAADRIGKQTPDIARFSSKSRQAKLLKLYHLGNTLTDSEAALLIVPINPPGPFQGCRRRCSDLRAAGYIADTDIRRCNDGSPDEAMVCTITDKGREAIRHLEQKGWSK